jgi:hypothetical protein
VPLSSWKDGKQNLHPPHPYYPHLPNQSYHLIGSASPTPSHLPISPFSVLLSYTATKSATQPVLPHSWKDVKVSLIMNPGWTLRYQMQLTLSGYSVGKPGLVNVPCVSLRAPPHVTKRTRKGKGIEKLKYTCASMVLHPREVNALYSVPRIAKLFMGARCGGWVGCGFR